MISIVIPAYNEEKHIAATLQSLVMQTTKRPFEVIVVNNASTDRTRIVASRFRSKLNLKIIDQPVRGRGAARAKGFLMTRGNPILSTDADTVVPPNWIDGLVSGFNGGQIVAVTGTCRITDCPRLTEVLFNFLQPQFMRAYKLVYKHYWLTGSNFAITRAAYSAAGGFNPECHDLEDIDLAFRVWKVGPIGMLRDLPVATKGNRFVRNLYGGLYAYIRSFIGQFWLKDKKKYKRD